MQVLRVFPNPERYKTCYVDDWDERIKKVDRDRVHNTRSGSVDDMLAVFFACEYKEILS